MLYREMEKTGDKLSILGFGCMRYPRKNGRIDFERTKKQIISAIDNGINYFDTAYMYPGSEEVLGKILSEGYREKVKIATKLLMIVIKTREDMDKMFEKQLKRLQTDYIDYYMLHSINLEQWENLKDNGLIEFIEEEQNKGRILNIGFSFHGNVFDFKKLVDDYDWDFCMIQYNYLDENYQAGKEGLDYASSKGLGIIAMEPLRGGMLVDKLPDSAKKIIENFHIKKTPAEWALRWLWDNPNINVVLSGMNREKDVAENIAIASNVQPNSLKDDEKEMINEVKEEFKNRIKIDCTACGYCLPCPHGVDIPMAFSSLNDKAIFGGMKSNIQYLMTTTENDSLASKCNECGICEKKCPQNIAIVEELKIANSDLEKWYLKIVLRIAKIFMPLF
ncbi:L-glyceraldehyde 3-phosphate reductase [Methanobrevibacter cuticularis]|uniref:L-glyceraldehyde 3-phosphate reductase n=1 Tax=Methanobrevibacter cuticularis TaxID=47311 RepID=A0A166D5Y4_9EURY|nr:aldo/keto reductase [Methanobrevibacter cuticularis]KZX15240.1 L-glyceraldehyde 3-phosphate reductase [Methanobrevibacter cuticularis]